MNSKEKRRQRRLQKHKENRQKHVYAKEPSHGNRKYRKLLVKGKVELEVD